MLDESFWRVREVFNLSSVSKLWSFKATLPLDTLFPHSRRCERIRMSFCYLSGCCTISLNLNLDFYRKAESQQSDSLGEGNETIFPHQCCLNG